MTRKTFFCGVSFKFNNLGLAVGMTLEFYASVAKGLKLKVRKFWGLIPTFVEVTVENLAEGLFCPPSWVGLKVKTKLSACAGPAALRQLNPIHKREQKILRKKNRKKFEICYYSLEICISLLMVLGFAVFIWVMFFIVSSLI